MRGACADAGRKDADPSGMLWPLPHLRSISGGQYLSSGPPIAQDFSIDTLFARRRGSPAFEPYKLVRFSCVCVNAHGGCTTCACLEPRPGQYLLHRRSTATFSGWYRESLSLSQSWIAETGTRTAATTEVTLAGGDVRSLCA